MFPLLCLRFGLLFFGRLASQMATNNLISNVQSKQINVLTLHTNTIALIWENVRAIDSYCVAKVMCDRVIV